MSDDPWWDEETDSWKKYYHALGVVSSRYNRLEATLFGMICGFQNGAIRINAFLFQKLPTDQRLQWLKLLKQEKPQPQEMSDAIDHFMRGYSDCTHNRGVLMHSLILAYTDGGDGAGDVFIASKTSRKSGNELIHRFPIDVIRHVANDIISFSFYGGHLHRMMNPLPLPDWAIPIWPATLPNKPALPLRLEGSSPDI